MESRRSQNALSLAVAFLALAIATTGTAVATSGQLVHIVDPSTGVGARVTGGGALRVSDTNGGPMTVDGSVGVSGPVAVGDGEGPLTVDGTVALAGRPTVEVAPQTPFQRYVEATPVASASRGCTVVPAVETGAVRLSNVSVTTYYSPSTPVAYLRYLVKKANGVGRIMQLRIPLEASESDPTTGIRTGQLELRWVVRAGGISAAQVGEVYQVEACVSKPVGETVEGSFAFAGTAL